jgi:hypothetical protein
VPAGCTSLPKPLQRQTRETPNMLSYECLLRHLRTESGLCILGAGTSAGVAPFGRSFWTAAPLDFLRNLSGFSAQIPIHSELTQQIIKNSRDIKISEIFPYREIRAGTDDFPYREILQRLPNYYARLLLKHRLAKNNFVALRSDNYAVFEFFRPSLIANYNHDGLASRLCGRRHRVLDMHGSVGREFGSPQVEAIIERIREHHLPEASDGILMGILESPCRDPGLVLRLLEIGRFRPAFIAIIGYSFARNAEGHDDHVSLEYFEHRFSDFRGQVYVIDPQPDYLREMLSERLKLRGIIGVRARWNVLAHSFMKSLHAPCGYERQSINYVYESLLDTHGGDIAFPLVDE